MGRNKNKNVILLNNIQCFPLFTACQPARPYPWLQTVTENFQIFLCFRRGCKEDVGSSHALHRILKQLHFLRGIAVQIIFSCLDPLFNRLSAFLDLAPIIHFDYQHLFC